MLINWKNTQHTNNQKRKHCVTYLTNLPCSSSNLCHGKNLAHVLVNIKVNLEVKKSKKQFHFIDKQRLMFKAEDYS